EGTRGSLVIGVPRTSDPRTSETTRSGGCRYQGAMEQRPLPDLTPLDPASEPHLELLPQVVEGDLAPAEAEEAEVEEAEEEEEESAPQVSDPLKLYVRQLGDGRLLTPAEERALAKRK